MHQHQQQQWQQASDSQIQPGCTSHNPALTTPSHSSASCAVPVFRSAGVKAHASGTAAPEAADAAATAAIANTPPGSTHNDSVLSPSSFVRFMPNPTAFGQGEHDGPGVERSDKRLGGPGDITSGFSMLGSALPSFELMQRMRKSLSPEELQSAFARRWACTEGLCVCQQRSCCYSLLCVCLNRE